MKVQTKREKRQRRKGTALPSCVPGIPPGLKAGVFSYLYIEGQVGSDETGETVPQKRRGGFGGGGRHRVVVVRVGDLNVHHIDL